MSNEPDVSRPCPDCKEFDCEEVRARDMDGTTVYHGQACGLPPLKPCSDVPCDAIPGEGGGEAGNGTE